MGNFIEKIKKFLLQRIFNRTQKELKLSFEEKVELGKVNNFHGNNKVRNISIGKNSYVSYNSIVYHADIGDYCSIGPNVVIGYGDHPTNMISTSPHIYLNSLLFDENETASILISHFNKVKIMNDVWIGANVYIKNGVKIGNGAIIGAGAVVLKDVDDYDIVAGVPAKFIRKRFDSKVIELLLKIKWWEMDFQALKKYKDVLSNPTTILLNEMIKKMNHDI
ncbi:CatB-related O-acetyltransferase [Flavobacterium turcicum]|uniref:CatB-related O-acetyltransferase n=1 Tax=Flavobacterium turcicum TaxID=2764718 RepID=A0ABR7JGM9_9FLAO|nr:CatB-related O-acetyltransferase [Flavobacterium turcicum]MBC5863655.1 CatB-related O-acetyltransferase [Flavobacterium turcicum]NHL02395.1 CatB-related O-acetyltransferase [Flavobacterium turcicum]